VPIIGGDNYETLSKWKNHEELLNNYQFMVYPRPGCSRENFYPQGKFIWIEAPLIEISSTFIRQNIAQNHDIRHFLPPGVYKHIKKMGFYFENA
jgi:nicotinate-nucleotide adenylyltransferase